MNEDLSEVARLVDRVTVEARSDLVTAVRGAARAGLTQAEIARAICRSQAEVSRLIHFHGTSPLARRLRKGAEEVKRIIGEAGGADMRVFGSVATGADGPDSDVDLLFTMRKTLSLIELVDLETRVSSSLGVSEAVPS